MAAPPPRMAVCCGAPLSIPHGEIGRLVLNTTPSTFGLIVPDQIPGPASWRSGESTLLFTSFAAGPFVLPRSPPRRQYPHVRVGLTAARPWGSGSGRRD